MHRRHLAPLLALTLLFTGCSRVTEGFVQGRNAYPARTWIWMMPITHVMTVGKATEVFTTFIPIPMYDPPAWSIVVEGRDQHGKTRQVEWFLPESAWDTTAVGGWVCRSPDCAPERAHVRQDERH